MEGKRENSDIIKRLLDGLSRYRYQSYEPLMVTFRLGSPVVLNHPWIYLDSTVMFLMVRDVLGPDFYTVNLNELLYHRQEILSPDSISCPIQYKHGLFMCSASMLDINSKYLETIYKRVEPRWMGGKKKVALNSGYFLNFMIRHIYVPASSVTFYLSGNREGLDGLLRNLNGIGDNTRIGWGKIRGFEIERTDVDYSLVKEGRAMRPIPVELLKDYSEAIPLTYRPPYWDRRNVRLCAPPGARVVLKDGT